MAIARPTDHDAQGVGEISARDGLVSRAQRSASRIVHRIGAAVRCRPGTQCQVFEAHICRPWVPGLAALARDTCPIAMLRLATRYVCTSTIMPFGNISSTLAWRCAMP